MIEAMQAGDRIGGYELLELDPAEAGVASYVARRACDGAFGHRVALTVVAVSPHDHAFIEMMLDQARLYRALDHQNLVRLLDLGATDGHAFFATELVVGATLDELHRRLGLQSAPDLLEHPYRHRPRGQQVPFGIALAIACAVCAGLHYAHECTTRDGRALDIVHREVSPRNVVIGFDGSVKLGGIGLARSLDRDDRRVARMHYFSPEQCRGKQIDRRSDIYALAAVVWELTVGAPRFANEMTDIEVLTAIARHDAIPPTQRNEDYPPELERIVMRGLAREPDARYQTADELHADLETFVRTSSCWASPRDIAAFMRRVLPAEAARTIRLS